MMVAAIARVQSQTAVETAAAVSVKDIFPAMVEASTKGRDFLVETEAPVGLTTDIAGGASALNIYLLVAPT